MAGHLVEADLSGGVVQIDVGESRTPFDVHIELLCSCSPYFENLFQSRYDKAIAEPVILPDEDPQVFAQVILWMYRGDCSDALGGKKVELLVRLWILAGNLEMKSLQNSVMDICVSRYDQYPTPDMDQDLVNHIYSHTLPESPMRRLAVDVWVEKANTKSFQETKGEFSRSFLEDLCAGLMKKREGGLPTLLRHSFEDRYLVRLSSAFVFDREVVDSQELRAGPIEIKQAATATQMNARKLKPLRSRRKDKSRVSASISVTPASTEAGVDEQQDMAENLYKLNIHT